VFAGRFQQFGVYKAFDMDNDGYVSATDLSQALTKFKIPHNSGELKQLMTFLDSNHNGFVDFVEFSAKIKPNIIHENHDRL
jgi:Ca2+-binding EF-hand superfamily protein